MSSETKKAELTFLFLIVLLFFPAVVFSQINQTDASGLRQGLWQKKQANGQLLYEGHFKNGKPVGEWKRFHENGQVKALIHYAGDTAKTQLFDEANKLLAEGNYINQEKEGIWMYFADNKKVSEEQFVNGLKHGVSRKFYDSVKIMEETEWLKGKREGKSQVFFEDGKPYMQYKMANDKRNGLCIIYFQNGVQQLVANYENDLRVGDWNYHDETGKLLYTLKYKNGALLNPEVRDSLERIQFKNLEKNKGSILDPEKFMEDPGGYMMKKNIYR